MRSAESAVDAHVRADAALLEGWKAKASQILLEALVQNPSRTDLRCRLNEVDALTAVDVRSFRPRTQPIWNILHCLVGWVLQLALFVGIFALCAVPAAAWLGDRPIAGLGQLAGVLGLMSACSLFAVLVWSRLYLMLWFKYLKWVPRSQAPNAASWLAAYTTCWQFSKSYWRLMEGFYAERYRA